MTANEERSITIHDVEARLRQLMEALATPLADTVRSCVELGRSATWVAVLFDASDERGMVVYRTLGPKWEKLPTGGAIVVASPLNRLAAAVAAAGYKRDQEEFGEHRAGHVRVVALTLGVMAVQHARVVDMDTLGSA